MVTDSQVRLLRQKLMEGKTTDSGGGGRRHERADVRVTWKEGPLPSETKEPRDWRTRPDPFAEVWEDEVVPLLERDEERILEAQDALG